MASNSKRASSLQLIMIWLFGVNKTNQDLWLSDHPVVRKAVIKQMSSSGRGLMSPGVRVHFPISPKLELLICDPMFYEEARILDGTVIETTENDVLRSNLVQAVHALSVDLIAKMVHWKIKELSSNLRSSPYQQVRKILHWPSRGETNSYAKSDICSSLLRSGPGNSTALKTLSIDARLVRRFLRSGCAPCSSNRRLPAAVSGIPS